MAPSKSRKDKDDTNNPDFQLNGIGNYLFQKTVGEGNFAKVKLAKHKITGAEVAIKIIDKTTLDEKKLGKLYREVRIMKLLNHPHIVKLYEVIETKYTVFLVMEYASGGELYDYLVVHGKMKEKEARIKFRQILSAVSYCHKKRVIHRDLKAENLLLDSNLDIKIADFGFSNYYDPDGKLDTFCGSPPYAAPELFQGKRYTGPEVDVWSLGVILYVLTTGCLPFDGKNLQEMRESVCRGKYRIPFYLSDVCEKLLRKFLIRDPYKRSNLDFLNEDPWINDGFTESPVARDVSTRVYEDDTIIKLLETKYNIPPESVLKSLRENIYDDVAAMYYLLYYDKDAAHSRRNSQNPSSSAKSNSGVPTIEIPGGSSTNSPPIASPIDSGAKSALATIPQQHFHSSTANPKITTTTTESITSTSTKPTTTAMTANQLRPQNSKSDRKRRFTFSGAESDAIKLAAAEDSGDGGSSSGNNNNVSSAKPSTETAAIVPDSIARNQLGTRQVPMDTSHLNTATSQQTVPTIDIQETDGASGKKGIASAASMSPNALRVGKLSDNNGNNSGGGSNTGAGGGLGKPRLSTEDSVDQVSSRKRGASIVGIIRNSMRRTSDVSGIAAIAQTMNSTTIRGIATNTILEDYPRETMATVAIDESVSTISYMKAEDGSNKPRSLRFTFNSSTTSSKPPQDIAQGVAAALEKHSVTYRTVTLYLFECFWPNPEAGKDGVKFEIEICKLPRLKNLHGLRFKRLAGPSVDYKNVCEQVFGAAGL